MTEFREIERIVEEFFGEYEERVREREQDDFNKRNASVHGEGNDNE